MYKHKNMCYPMYVYMLVIRLITSTPFTQHHNFALHAAHSQTPRSLACSPPSAFQHCLLINCCLCCCVLQLFWLFIKLITSFFISLVVADNFIFTYAFVLLPLLLHQVLVHLAYTAPLIRCLSIQKSLTLKSAHLVPEQRWKLSLCCVHFGEASVGKHM